MRDIHPTDEELLEYNSLGNGPEEPKKVELFDVRTFSNLGAELVDVVNVLRALHVPEKRIESYVTSRI